MKHTLTYTRKTRGSSFGFLASQAVSSASCHTSRTTSGHVVQCISRLDIVPVRVRYTHLYSTECAIHKYRVRYTHLHSTECATHTYRVRYTHLYSTECATHTYRVRYTHLYNAACYTHVPCPRVFDYPMQPLMQTGNAPPVGCTHTRTSAHVSLLLLSCEVDVCMSKKQSCVCVCVCAYRCHFNQLLNQCVSVTLGLRLTQ
jgi:hypothetical protein